MVPDNSWTASVRKGGDRPYPPFQHAANVATMALWLSVAAASAFAFCFPGRKQMITPVEADKDSTLEITLDAGSDVTSPSPDAGSQAGGAPPLRPLPFLRPLARPPEMPSIPVAAPLPSVPVLPRVARAIPVDQPSASARPSGQTVAGLEAAAARFAAGVTPEAPYPPHSKRNGQQGTVIVEFAVDGTGRVTAVFVKTPCRWPLLNQTAVRTVYSWRFPPGPFMTLEVPIVFKIQ